MKSNPYRMIDYFFEMQKELDRLFDDFTQPGRNITAETTRWRPPMDIYETVDSFVVKIEIAGLNPHEDVKIQLNRNLLTIEGYRQDRTALKKEHYHQAELSYGHFERSIVLPNVLSEDVEPVASYENGFLEIHVQKTKQDRAKEIVVQVKGELKAVGSEDGEQKEQHDGNPES